MGRAEHDIDRIRLPFQDRRHGVDHDLDAFVGRQQAECQNHRAPAEFKLGLGCVGCGKRYVGNAVGNDLDLVVRHVIDAAQEFVALVGHHDDLRRRLDDALHHRALDRSRFGQHRVQCRHDRHGKARQQLDDVDAGFPAENSEFVLKADCVEPAGIQEVCRTDIVFTATIPDLQGDRRRIVVGLTVIGHGHDAGLQVKA